MSKSPSLAFTLTLSALLITALSGGTNAQGLDFWLTADYPFNGSASDMSQFENHAMIMGSVPFVENRFGSPSSALHFDGNRPNYVVIPDAPHLDPPSLSMSLWVTADSLGPVFRDLIDKFTPASTSFWQVYWDKKGYLSFAISGGEVARTTEHPIHPDSQWNHLVAMYGEGASAGFIYINGVNVTDTTLTTTSRQLADNDVDIRLGQRGDGNCECWIGSVDDLKFYSRILTPEEVNDLYEASSPTHAETSEVPLRVTTATTYPNPFAAVTSIEFNNPKPQKVVVEVLDQLGRLVETVEDGFIPEGVSSFPFRADGLSAGLYIYRIRTESEAATGTMVLVR